MPVDLKAKMPENYYSDDIIAMWRTAGIYASQSLDYFQVLEIPHICSDADVKQAYLRLAKQWHPDVNKSPDAVEKFKCISNAYDELKDELRRSHYRAELQSQLINKKYGHYQRSSAKYYSDYHKYYNQQDPYQRSTWSTYRVSSFSSSSELMLKIARRFLLFGGPLLGMYLVLSLITDQSKSNLNDSSKSDKQTVEAWFNPK